MKAITLWQPYASLVAIGAKTIETRSWGTHHRGPLLIHAAMKWDSDVQDDCRRACRVLDERSWRPSEAIHSQLQWESLMRSRGRVLCLANLIDCRPMPESPGDLDGEFGSFGPGRYGWVLADVVPLFPPVPWSGLMGLWTAPPALVEVVRGAMTRQVDYFS